MYNFRKEYGDWTRYRLLPKVKEIDLHYSNLGGASRDDPKKPYDERMADIYQKVLDELKSAFESGDVAYLLVIHGSSTSRPGNTTSRSQIRKLMGSKDATPYIARANSIQHDTVFVAAIKPCQSR